MHFLLLLLVLLLLLGLAEWVTLLIRVVVGLIVLGIALLLAFTHLPAWLVVIGLVVFVALLILQGVADAKAAAALRTSIAGRIRDLERKSNELHRSFEERSQARNEAFHLRCQIDDWEGWP
jgi:flagellar biosynthesis protein FliP